MALSIYFTALARCASGEAFGLRRERQAQVLRAAQEAWRSHGTFEGSGPIMLNALLHVCCVAASREALGWAEELWALAEGSFEPNGVNRETFVTMLSKCGEWARVDEMLEEDWQPSAVLLAALLHVAGEARDLARCQQLWQRLPLRSLTCYASYAKAMLLGGRPKEILRLGLRLGHQECADVIEHGIAVDGLKVPWHEPFVWRSLVFKASFALPCGWRLVEVNYKLLEMLVQGPRSELPLLPAGGAEGAAASRAGEPPAGAGGDELPAAEGLAAAARRHRLAAGGATAAKAEGPAGDVARPAGHGQVGPTSRLAPSTWRAEPKGIARRRLVALQVRKLPSTLQSFSGVAGLRLLTA